MKSVTLRAILEVAPSLGLPRDKKRLRTHLAKSGARFVDGVSTRGQRGHLYILDTLPPAIRDALARAGRRRT
ncbi:MAG: hypothetical protein HC829_07470, partial [Bacteroidales bacterium]|nr:hypothetical protein [Bacteroidales bacterium]